MAGIASLTLTFLLMLPMPNAKARATGLGPAKIDLREWNRTENPVIQITGEVEFHWHRFIVSNSSPTANPIYLNLPGRWNIEGGFPAYGYGSYRFRILLPTNDPVAILLAPPWSSMRLFIDGKLKVNQGIPGQTPQTTTSFVKNAHEIVVQPHNRTIEFVLEVANWDVWQGGGVEVTVGDPDALSQKNRQRFLFSAFCIGACFMIGLYHLIIFMLRRIDYTSLFFAIFCLVEGLSHSVWGSERFLLEFFHVPFRFTLDLANASWAFMVMSFGIYMWLFFPKQYNTNVMLFFTRAFLIVLILEFALKDVPIKIFVQTFQVLSTIYITYAYWPLYKAIREKVQDSKVFLFFNVGLALMGTYETIALTTGQTLTTRIGLYGAIFFIIGQSFILSRRFSRAYFTAEHLSENLQTEVELQTRELQSQKMRLIEQTDIINEILDNAQIALLLVDETRRIMVQGYSAMAMELLQKDLDGKLIEEVLFSLEKDRKSFRGLFEQIFEVPLIAEEMAEQLPKSFMVGNSCLSLEARVIRDHEHHVKSVLLSLKDDTELVKSRRENTIALELFQLLKQKDRFKIFLNAFETSMARIDELLNMEENIIQSEAGRVEVKLILHTIKGNILSFKIANVFPLHSLCHELEENDHFNRNDWNAIQNAVRKFLSENERTLDIIMGERRKGTVPFEGTVIRRLINALDTHDRQNEEIVRLKRELTAASKGFDFKSILQGWASETERLGNRLNRVVQFEAYVPDGVLNGDLYLFHKLFDSFIHAIRNSIDHGVEPVYERRTKFKPETARIIFEYEVGLSGEIIITLSDDGRGLSRSRILSKAKERLKGMDLTPFLSDSDWPLLLFEPGFSTKDGITDISGRGIGMAAIKSAVIDLGGQLKIVSKEGEYFRLICIFPGLGIHEKSA